MSTSTGALFRLYDVLGVDRHATADEIRRAYRMQALRYHPDKNQSQPDVAHKRFQDVNHAYTTLGDVEKRRLYDLTGDEHLPGEGSARGSSPFFSSMWTARASSAGDRDDDLFHFFDLDTLFRKFAASSQAPFRSQEEDDGGGPRMKRRYENTTVHAHVCPAELKHGATKTLRASMHEGCARCRCTGIESAQHRKTACRECAGQGTFLRRLSPFVAVQTLCSSCGGDGTKFNDVTPNNACRACGGVGTVRVLRTVRVNTPGGVEDGRTYKWEKPDSGVLHIVIHHDDACRQYAIDGATGTVTVHVPLTLREVLIGYEKTVNVMGKLTTLRSGTRYTHPETVVVLRGAGIGAGDFVIRFTVQWPPQEKEEEGCRYQAATADGERADEAPCRHPQDSSARVQAKNMRKYADVLAKILPE